MLAFYYADFDDEEIVIKAGFVYEGDREIEPVFARTKVLIEEIGFVGDANKEASGGSPTTRYAARVKARLDPRARSGEYRCAYMSACDRLDD